MDWDSPMTITAQALIPVIKITEAQNPIPSQKQEH